jgi:GNAT superfamily N-acetyltransferase
MSADSPQITVRPTTRADVPLILKFIRDLASYEKLLHEVEADEERLARTLFPGPGKPPAAHVVIGELGGRPEGFAVYFFSYSTFLAKECIYLEDIFVNPEARGNGLGKAFLLHLAKVAVDRGCGRVNWAALDWNTPAVGFYKGLGAIALDEWTTFRLAGPGLEALAARA